MPKVTIQMGHCFRKTGATGGKGEQTFASEVGSRLAKLLRDVGHDVALLSADENVPDYRDVFVALHTDGSTNATLHGASVGYPSSDTGRMAAAWKRAWERAGYRWGWHADNYTPALRQYYGFGSAVGYKHEYLAEHGMHSNAEEYAFLHGSGAYDRAAQAHFAAIGEIVGHPKPPVAPGPIPVTPPADPTPTTQAITATALKDGRIYTFSRDGGVFTEGGAHFIATPPVGHRPIVAGRATLGDGYRLASDDGGVFCFGDAGFHGSLGGIPLNGPVTDMFVTPSGQGYSLIGADGGVFNFGDASDHGSAVGNVPSLAQIIVAGCRTPSGSGYWLAGRDGAVHARGDAGYFGSLTGLGITPNRPVEAIVGTPSGQGYILVCGDGGLFAFGDAPVIQPYGPLQQEVYAGHRYIEDGDWFDPGKVLFLVSNLGERWLLG